MSRAFQTWGMNRETAALLILTLAAPPASSSQAGYRNIAKEFSQSALKHGAVKVAVLPFAEADGRASGSAARVAERLTTDMVRIGRVQVVERSLLGNVPDAVVTGSVYRNGDKLDIYARLIEPGTGRVLSARHARVEREWTDDIQVPAMEMAGRALAVPVPGLLRDSLGERDCGDAGETLERMERSILQLKARYWASRMSAPGFSSRALISNPGSEILDRGLRSRFYELLGFWRSRGEAAGLTAGERETLLGAMRRMAALAETCGGSLPELERSIRQME